MTSSKYSKRFVKIFLLVFATLALCTIGVNYLIDPFGLHQTPVIESLNKTKADVGNHDRLEKAIEIIRKKPKAILLGSSRVLLGINNEDVEAVTGMETYNAGLKAACFEEIYHYFEHALYHQPDLKVVIIGLDFCAFNQHMHPPPHFRLDRIKTNCWRDFYASLFTFHALKCSLQTFKTNFFPNSAIGENGIVAMGEPAYLKITLRYDYKKYQHDQKRIEMFQKIVKTCEERAIDLKFFFCPTKAIYWEAIYRSELWPAFEDLKQQLTAIYPIWDFSGFNCVTTNTLEKELNHSLYYECSHFTPFVGKMIIDKMFNQTEFPAHFGYFLTSQTIESALKQMREQAISWLNTHDNILDEISKVKD